MNPSVSRTRYDPAKWAAQPWYILITPARRTGAIMTTTDLDVADHHAAGSLADELPYWGWLPDDRTCLTRRGELVTLARLTPTVVDGHTPAQLDAVLNRWQRMLSGIDSRTRIYFYLLRRPAIFPDADTGLSTVADLGQRKRRAFLASRIQQIETYPRLVLRPETLDGRSRPGQQCSRGGRTTYRRG